MDEQRSHGQRRYADRHQTTSRHLLVPTSRIDRVDVQPNVLDQNCESRQALDRIADKWTCLVVYALVDGPRRHGELRRTIQGISQKMLTQTLRGLGKAGVAPEQLEHTSFVGKIGNLGAASVALDDSDLLEIEGAASGIAVQGARYPVHLDRLTGR